MANNNPCMCEATFNHRELSIWSPSHIKDLSGLWIIGDGSYLQAISPICNTAFCQNIRTFLTSPMVWKQHDHRSSTITVPNSYCDLSDIKMLHSFQTKRQKFFASSFAKPLVSSRSDHSPFLAGLAPQGRTGRGIFLDPIYAQEPWLHPFVRG